MPIQITPVLTGKAPASGLTVQWKGGQFVMIVTDKGLVSCGIIDKEVVERVGYATAIAYGTPEKQLITVNDLLEAKIREVSPKAKELGVLPGMTGRDALEKLSD